MKYIKQLTIIIFICLIGEFVVMFLPFAFPGNIMAMLILTGLLGVKLIKEEQIIETTNFLLEIIGVFILPVAVGVISYFELISAVWWQLSVISLITLFLTFASCAFTIRLTMKIMQKKAGG